MSVKEPTRDPQSAAARAQRPQSRTAARRRAVLEAAMTVFGSRGYRNGSLAEIAQLAGMTHAGVLHHFGSKELLLIAMLDYRDLRGVEDYEGHHAPAGQAFLDHLVATVRENSGTPGIVQAYAVLAGESLSEDHPAGPFFRERLAGLRAMVAEALVLATGAPPSPEVDRVAAAIVAVMDGLQVQWFLAPESIDMPETVRLTIEALCDTLRD